MKNILLVGVGRFGRHIAVQLTQMGHQVMAVDTSEDRINDVLPFVTNAQIGDSTMRIFFAHSVLGIMMSALLQSAAISKTPLKRPRF